MFASHVPVTFATSGTGYLGSMGTSAFNSSSSAQPTTERAFATAIPAEFQINGAPDNGIMNLTLPEGQQSTINISAAYHVPTTISFSIATFPLGTSLPPWLSFPSVPSSISLSEGRIGHTSLIVGVDSSLQNGEQGLFALRAHYLDPSNSMSIIQVMVFRVQVNTFRNNMSTSPHTKSLESLDSLSPLTSTWTSWALGAGLCDSSSTSQCQSNGVSWNQVTAIKTSYTIPNLKTQNATFITLNGSPASGYLLQFVVLMQNSNSYWEEQIQLLYPSSPACIVNLAQESSGASMSIEIGRDSNGWFAYDYNSLQNYYYSNYCSNVPTSSDFYSQNQEPFAFESYDDNGSDFSLVYINVNPTFEYLTGGNWVNPATAEVLNANDAGQWGSYVIGGGFSTPSEFSEAGNHQCSAISKYQIYIGYYTQGYLLNCGTSTYDTPLW